MKKLLPFVAMVAISTGCSSMLPSKTVDTQTQWASYQEVETVVKAIRRGHPNIQRADIIVERLTHKALTIKAEPGRQRTAINLRRG